MNGYKKGHIIKVTITNIKPYGAFVEVDKDYSGLIHISEISEGFVRDLTKILKPGDMIDAEILGVDNTNKHLDLSIKKVKTGDKKKKIEIIETKSGFETLRKKLPIWIDEKIKTIKNK